MNRFLTVLAAASPGSDPEESLRPGLEPGQVSPGLLGFIATFFLVVAVVLLILDFNRRNRRLRYRAQYAEQRAAEEHVGGYAEAGTPAASERDTDPTPGSGARAGSGAGPAAEDDDAAPGSPDASRPGPGTEAPPEDPRS